MAASVNVSLDEIDLASLRVSTLIFYRPSYYRHLIVNVPVISHTELLVYEQLSTAR